MKYFVTNLNIIPKDFRGEPLVDGNGNSQRIGEILSAGIGTQFKSNNQVELFSAYEVGKRLFETKDDQIEISEAERDILLKILPPNVHLSPLLAHVLNDKIIVEENEE